MFSLPSVDHDKPIGPMRIILPALLLVLLCIWIVVKGALPLVEDRLLRYRKDMVRELAQTAVQILQDYHRQAENGRLTRAEAQTSALHLLEGLRYGPEGKDYFWVNDFTPKLIMHPYRPDLVGRDVAAYQDSQGRYLFREFVRVARSEGGGFVTYMWQWQDDPQRIVPKISYVQRFAPWDWIVGTGIYIEDIRAEIGALYRRLAVFSAALLLLMLAFSGYYLWQWRRVEGRRRQAWQGLSESREKYRAVLESSPNAVVVYDQDGRVLYLNAAFTRIFGWTYPELAGQRIDFVPEDARAETQAAIKAAFAEGAYAFETRRRRKDGRLLDVRISAATYRLSDGRTGGMVVNLEDVSDRKAAEVQLRESQEMFLAIGFAARDVIVMIDNTGEIAYWSRAGEDILGYRQEEVLGKPLHHLLAPERYLKKFDRAFKAFQATGRGDVIGRTVTLAALHRSGREVPVELSLASVRLKGTWHAVGIMRDISDRQKTERALRESEEKYRLLTESITETIWTMNMDLAFTYISPSTVRIQGWSPQEMMAMPLDRIMPAASFATVTTTLAEELAEGERGGAYGGARTLELELYHKAGGTVWTEVTATIMVDADGRPSGILGVTRDVTPRKQAEAEKKELREKLSRSRKMEALGLLAGGVAHDLNNVLSGIVSYPDLILMDLPQQSPLREFVLTIKESGIKAAAIVQDLLTLARRGAVSFEVLNLNAIVTDVLRSPEHRKLVEFHPDVDIQVRCEPALPDLEGSPVHLKKTVLNLIANAAEAQPGGGLVAISTESRYLDTPLAGYDEVAQGEYVVLRVADQGRGIAEEDLSRIFEPFYTKKVLGRSGTGLGMAVVWGTVQDHRGYIDIHSAENKGTVFELYFPMTRKPRSDREETTDEAIRGRNETILVVDDIQEQREIAAMILGRLNYAVTTASSGEKAVSFLKENDVDLVILDMIMDPGMDGLDTYHEIRAIKPHQKVVIASGFAETERVKKALDLGVGYYLKKPYTLEKIGLVVRRELDRQDGV